MAGLWDIGDCRIRSWILLQQTVDKASGAVKGAVSDDESAERRDFFWRSDAAGRVSSDIQKNFVTVVRVCGVIGEKMLFSSEIRKILSRTSLAKEDLEQLEDLGRHLGYLDRQTQLRTLDLYTHNLDTMIQELRQELPGRKKMYQSLGIMGGLFLAVLLL